MLCGWDMFWEIYHQHSSTTFRSCRTWITSPFWGTGHQSDRCPLQKPKNHDSETKMCDSETKMCDSETNIYDSETKTTDSATKTEAIQKPKRTNSETKNAFRNQNVRLRNQNVRFRNQNLRFRNQNLAATPSDHYVASWTSQETKTPATPSDH